MHIFLNNKPFERIDKIIAEYESKYGKIESDIRITIMGDEPLLCQNLKAVAHILKSSSERNYTVDIVSIGVNFDKYKDTLKHIQITVDGVKKLHDARRIFPDKRGSFDIIMANIKLAIGNNIKIVLRVNVDAININKFLDLADTLIERFGKMIFYYHIDTYYKMVDVRENQI